VFSKGPIPEYVTWAEAKWGMKQKSPLSPKVGCPWPVPGKGVL
jgi:hypothetical protein